jgi:hypothetical protein
LKAEGGESGLGNDDDGIDGGPSVLAALLVDEGEGGVEESGGVFDEFAEFAVGHCLVFCGEFAEEGPDYYGELGVGHGGIIALVSPVVPVL